MPTETESQTITRRPGAPDFPACLMVERNPNYTGPHGRDRQWWMEDHNRALSEWRPSGANRGTYSERKRDESAVLDLLYGIHRWTELHDGSTDYVAADVVGRLVTAASGALNYDLGRLDGGALSGWLCELAERAGVEL